MTTPTDPTGADAGLRQRAEAQARGTNDPTVDQLALMKPEQLQRTLHELHVHQIELEMQNEDLRRTQVELDVARKRYFDLFDLAPVGYCTITAGGLIEEANLTAASLLGEVRSSLGKRPFSAFITPEDQDRFHLLRRRLMDTGAPEGCELRLLRKGQADFWALLEARLEVDAGGSPSCRLVISDISVGKAAELEAQEAKLRLEALFQGARDAILLADPATGIILDVNRQAEALLGQTRQALIGMHQSRLHPAELREALRADFARHASGVDERVETLVLHQDGSRTPVEITSSLIPLPDGRQLLMGLFRDIRERLRLQETVRHSEKMTAIGELAGGIAHDFNNQLAGISGYAELLAAAQTDPDKRKWAEAIQGAALRSAELTRQLLAFGRKSQSRRTPTDLRQVIAEVIELLRHSLDRRITLVQRHNGPPSLILGDPGQLHTALLNLALNARDAMPDGGELAFATRHSVHEDPARRFIEIAVSDTGSGMDAATRQRIFEPFFTTKEPGKGTGLGLATVYGVVRNHGGVISVDSTPGQGSTFTIALPLLAGPGGESGESRAAHPSQAAVPRRILVVDDEDVVRNITGELLRHLGHVAITCTSADEAVERCQRDGPFDVVILDLIMPRSGGRQSFIALRAAQPGLRIIIASGLSLNDEVQALLDLGACGFLQKPFTRGDLGKAVEAAMATGVAPTP